MQPKNDNRIALNLEDLDKLFKMVVNQVTRKMEQNKGTNNPLALEFVIKMDNAGNIRITDGSTSSNANMITGTAKTVQTTPKQHEPLFETSYDKENVYVTAELRGVNKKDIKIKAYNQKLAITIANETPFRKEIPLQKPILPDSASATFTNSILELSFKIEKPSAAAVEREIPIQ